MSQARAIAGHGKPNAAQAATRGPSGKTRLSTEQAGKACRAGRGSEGRRCGLTVASDREFDDEQMGAKKSARAIATAWNVSRNGPVTSRQVTSRDSTPSQHSIASLIGRERDGPPSKLPARFW